MSTNNLFERVMGGEELDDVEKLRIARLSASRGNVGGAVEKILSGGEISMAEKLSIANELITAKLRRILEKEIVIAKVSGCPCDISLNGSQCSDPDKNIRKYLSILGARDISVTSDFPGYNETYEGSTKIKFSL